MISRNCSHIFGATAEYHKGGDFNRDIGLGFSDQAADWFGPLGRTPRSSLKSHKLDERHLLQKESRAGRFRRIYGLLNTVAEGEVIRQLAHVETTISRRLVPGYIVATHIFKHTLGQMSSEI